MKTNRDLYKSVERLLEQKKDQPVPSLEVYLSNLLCRATQLAHKKALTLEEFFSLLRDSFNDHPDVPKSIPVENIVPQFHEWKATVVNQIRDLREMAQNGQLKNEYRYFGMAAPSGDYWYNFDPCAYIECGLAGSLGGWEEGDETGRTYVPGPVACLDSEGRIQSRVPKEVDLPLVEVPLITWKMFSQFVWCGQEYE